jgi:hypothetical protein
VTWLQVISWLTGVSSLGVKFVGFPGQVRKNRRDGRAGRGAGTTVTIGAAFTASYGVWVLYGVAFHSWTIIVSQGFGVVVSGILLGQALWYRGRYAGDSGVVHAASGEAGDQQGDHHVAAAGT